jgi:hypothetical protein
MPWLISLRFTWATTAPIGSLPGPRIGTPRYAAGLPVSGSSTRLLVVAKADRAASREARGLGLHDRRHRQQGEGSPETPDEVARLVGHPRGTRSDLETPGGCAAAEPVFRSLAAAWTARRGNRLTDGRCLA